MKGIVTGSSLRRPGGGGGGGTTGAWKPDPPSSSLVKPTGTVSFTATAFNGSTIDTLFHPSTQHIVRTSNGTLFATGLTRDNTSTHSPSTWVLMKSINGGTSWTTMWNSLSQGDPQYGISPALELDENDNLYVIANYYTAGSSMVVKLYKFTAASGYSTSITPSVLDTNGRSSGKWGVMLDQTRQWLWILLWSDINSPNLFAYDYNGIKQYSRQVFKLYSRDWSPTQVGATDKYAPSAHYPYIWVDTAGAVYVAWTSFPFQSPTTSFYDVRMIYSQSTTTQFKAGTETWLGPTNGTSGAVSARTIPICTDDSSTSLAERAFPICKTGTDFVSATDPSYWNGSSGSINYNRLQGFAVNGNAAHFYYESESSFANVIKHHSYAPLRLATGTITDSERGTPEWLTDDGTPIRVGEGGGQFAQDTTMAGRLYFVTRTVSDADKKILVLRSDDAGASWFTYAISPALTGAGSNGLLLAQCYRFVGTDGVISGIVQYADSPYACVPFLVTPN